MLSRAMKPHVDHQMRDALCLARELSTPSAPYPKTVWRAMRLAYAMHFRTLFEFFHGGSVLRARLRPRSRRQRPPDKRDITIADVLPKGVALGVAPSRAELRRFNAADKLAAHMSRQRGRWQGSLNEWGCEGDQRCLTLRIAKLFESAPQADSWFPETASEMRRAG